MEHGPVRARPPHRIAHGCSACQTNEASTVRRIGMSFSLELCMCTDQLREPYRLPVILSRSYSSSRGTARPLGPGSPPALRIARRYTKPQETSSQALGGAWPGSARLQSAVYRHAFQASAISASWARSRHPHGVPPCAGTVSRGAGTVSRGAGLSLAGHGLTALGPRPIPRLSRPCARACGVARCAPNRLSCVRAYPLPHPSRRPTPRR